MSRQDENTLIGAGNGHSRNRDEYPEATVHEPSPVVLVSVLTLCPGRPYKNRAGGQVSPARTVYAHVRPHASGKAFPKTKPYPLGAGFLSPNP
jgi:hypothetical protein